MEYSRSSYIDYVPNAAQRSIGNFYDNLSYPNVVLNDFLQGKVRQGFQDTLRFAINSTIGLFGLFDMATHMGLQEHNEDFGQTLGVWGVTPGLICLFHCSARAVNAMSLVFHSVFLPMCFFMRVLSLALRLRFL